MTAGIKVLVVDDSAVVREALRAVLEHEPAVSAVETAADARNALRKLGRFDPDVVTMDVEMPGMDGLATLRQIMSTAPRPVIMLSAFTFQGARKTIRALELGAADFIQKPGGSGPRGVVAIADELVAKVLALGTSPSRNTRAAAPPPSEPDAGLVHKPGAGLGASAPIVVGIGASTGGTEAIRHIVTRLPGDFGACVLVTQHMPEGFTLAFANRLNELASVEVKEAAQHDLLRPGRVLIAPGHSHLLIRREEGIAFVELSRQPPINGHRPSVDVMFQSLAATYGSQCVGVLLTGMGKDGAQGLFEIRQVGGATTAESAESCVVFGMPKAAIDIGAAERVHELKDMAAFIERQVAMRRASPTQRAWRTSRPGDTQ